MDRVTTIEDLPEVILEYILSQLSPYDELLNCKLVCKNWYYLTHSALRKLKFNFKSSIKSLNIEWNKYTTTDWPNISGRYSHSSCILSKNMYIFGGCTNGSTTFNDLWVFNLNEKSWKRPLVSGTYPPPKACATMVPYKNKLLLFGGWTHCSAFPLNQDWKLFDDLHEFDIEKKKWTLIKSKYRSCPAMAGHGASVIGDKMIIFGGLSYSQEGIANPISVNRDIWVYDLIINKWSKKILNSVEKPFPRYGHTQISINETNIAIIGGCSGPKILYNDIWVLKMDLPDWSWKKIVIENNDAMLYPIFGFHPVVKVEDMVLFLSTKNKYSLAKTQQLIKNSQDPTLLSQLNRSYNENQNNNINSVNRLQAQPSQNERRAQFLASIDKRNHLNHISNIRRNSNFDIMEPRLKNLKSSTIKLNTVKNFNYIKANNPMIIYVLDISKILTENKALWINQTRKFDGPNEIMLYSLVAATNEIVLFGGIEKISSNHSNTCEKKIDHVSNTVYIASAKNVVI